MMDWTPLGLALQYDRSDIVAFLFASGVSPRSQATPNSSGIKFAQSRNNPAVLAVFARLAAAVS
jgi:hypothetical protein